MWLKGKLMVNDKNITSWVSANLAAVALAAVIGLVGYGELQAQVKSNATAEAKTTAEVRKLQDAQNKQAVAIGKIEVTTKNIEKNQAAMQRSLETIANRLTNPPR